MGRGRACETESGQVCQTDAPAASWQLTFPLGNGLFTANSHGAT